MGQRYRLEASLSATEDPEGVTVLKQTHSWTYELSPDEFYDDGEGFHIDAGSPDGPFHIELDVVSQGGEPCSAGQPSYVSRPPSGAFRIQTDNEVFADITEMPPCGRFYSFSNGEVFGPLPCPVPGPSLLSAVNVVERRRSESARFSYGDAQTVSISGEPVHRGIVLAGKVDASAFSLRHDLGARVRGEGLPWLSGTGVFRPHGRFVRPDWTECKGKREFRQIRREGEFDGDLTLDVIGEEDRVITSEEGFSFRTRVRSR
jgi:hypothetical protein